MPRRIPPVTLAEQVDGQTLSDDDREKVLARSYAKACLERFILNPGVPDEDVGPLLREFLQLTASRCGAYYALQDDEESEAGPSPLPYMVAKLRALQPWRAPLRLVVSNC